MAEYEHDLSEAGVLNWDPDLDYPGTESHLPDGRETECEKVGS